MQVGQMNTKEYNYDQSFQLLDVTDSGVRVEVCHDGSMYLFHFSVEYNFVISYQKDEMDIEFTKKELVSLLVDLSEGNKSCHGLLNVAEAKQIRVKENKMPVKFRDVYLYRRILIFFKLVPATFSYIIMAELEKLMFQLDV